MWTFLGRPVCILYLSSALSVMALTRYNQFPRLNQTHLTPLLLMTRGVGLKVEGSQFTLEGSPFRIISGTIDYFRIPRQQWRLSLQKMQAGGFNTLTTYVPWNLHEPAVGQFYFTENLDLIAFITMASEVGLWVIVCPGPYIGSDLDLGGLPSWLLKDPRMKLRTTYKGFTRAMNRYFDRLVPRIEQFQYRRGGPIIAVQIENEYGSYYMDKKYMAYVKMALVSRGISELLMTADDGLNLRKGHLKNVLATVHMKNIKKATYEDLKSIQGISPILMMVYTTKSFDTWGYLRNFGDPQMLMKDVHEMFILGFSFNFYMFHGGTNFGFIGGAQSSNRYLPVVTSYDYCALLTEAGAYTPEYRVFQEFFYSVTDPSTIIRPKIPLAIAYAPLTLIYFVTLWEVLPHLDQVFLDNNYVGVLDRYNNELLIVKDVSKKVQSLRILVENQGRLTSGKDINKERRGLTGDIYLNKTPLRQFIIHSLEMRSTFIQTKLPKFPEFWKTKTNQVLGPAFFLSQLRVGDPPQDTYIRVKGWGKGVIFINGQVLGRYWSIGPQEALYVPSSWLHPGVNEIMMFEELNGGQKIQFAKEPELGH
ncbi:beta-galactosidase-1-like protein 2 isoform X2 [Mesocricetus auratus]|uniref:Beta-galactosidase-1-like protein 2 isoform X2 n=1 Tax=Mesocricetus auratus TaxID=10036 RepID=A0ABM2WDK4_MESAU|nr:beta-galactosidase-1-like protein 2 isoform X2 [Mesocricetus auratus]